MAFPCFPCWFNWATTPGLGAWRAPFVAPPVVVVSTVVVVPPVVVVSTVASVCPWMVDRWITLDPIKLSAFLLCQAGRWNAHVMSVNIAIDPGKKKCGSSWRQDEAGMHCYSDPETQVVLPCFAIWILLHCRGMIPGRLEKFFHCRSPTPNLQSNVVQVFFALLQNLKCQFLIWLHPQRATRKQSRDGVV